MVRLQEELVAYHERYCSVAQYFHAVQPIKYMINEWNFSKFVKKRRTIMLRTNMTSNSVYGNTNLLHSRLRTKSVTYNVLSVKKTKTGVMCPSKLYPVYNLNTYEKREKQLILNNVLVCFF